SVVQHQTNGRRSHLLLQHQSVCLQLKGVCGLYLAVSRPDITCLEIDDLDLAVVRTADEIRSTHQAKAFGDPRHFGPECPRVAVGLPWPTPAYLSRRRHSRKERFETSDLGGGYRGAKIRILGVLFRRRV